MTDALGAYDCHLTIANRTSYPLKLISSSATAVGWGCTSEWRGNTKPGLVIAPGDTGPPHSCHTSGWVDSNGSLRFAVQQPAGDHDLTFTFAVQNYVLGKGWVLSFGADIPPALRSLLHVTGGGNAKTNPCVGQWVIAEYDQP